MTDEATRRQAILNDIADERYRQTHTLHWSTAHDDTHVAGELPRAAACYAWWAGLDPMVRECVPVEQAVVWRRLWPWERGHWHTSSARRALIKAAALLVAEIERLDRAAASVVR